MPNNFSTIKSNQASQKFFLVRLEPARYLNDLLSLDAGGIYQATISGLKISKVQANGSDLTKVTTVTNAGEWSYNESTGVFRVYSTPSSTNAIVAFFYLFYTGERFRVTYQDPEDSSTTLRDWEPKLKRSPLISSSIDEVINGKLQISPSSLTVINDSSEFQDYLTGNDSFFNKQIKIWTCLDSVDNIKKAFEGRITGLSLSRTDVKVQFEDNLSVLALPALMGDNSSYNYFNLQDNTNLDPQKNGRPIPFFFGRVTRYQLLREGVTNLTDARKLDPESLYEAVCTNYNASISNANNREWGLGRTKDGFLDFGFTPSAINQADANFTRLDCSSAQVAKIFIGDTFIIANGGTDYYFRVYHVDRSSNYVYCTKGASVSTGDAVATNKAPSVVIQQNATTFHYCLYGRDYTATESATSGGNKYLKITFTNNFEANHSGLVALDPTQHKVLFRVKPDQTNIKHGSVLKFLLEKAGLTVNASSVTTANTSLDVNANFSIPQFDETDFHEYFKYIELILSSALAYITLNNSFEIEYKLFSAPSSASEITDTDILEGTFETEINYKDIVSQIIAYNPHYSSPEATSTSSDSESSLKAQHLHGVNKTVRFRHVLEDITGRIVNIMKVRRERYATYNFDSKIINIDSILGDEFLLNKTGLLGGDSTKSVKVMELQKGIERTQVIATDLYNL